MSGVFENIEELPTPERRTYSRQPMRTITYVELDEGNGGIVLNASEGGLSVQAVMSLMEDSLPKMRFQLSQSKHWLETPARVVWANDSRKVAGVEFVGLPEEDRKLIREWLSGEVAEENPETAGLDLNGDGVASAESAAAESDMAARAPAEALGPSPSTHSFAETFGQAPSPQTQDPFVESVPTHEARSERAWNIAGLIAVLAVVSLAAGWIAGRGTLESLWQSLHRATPAATGMQAHAAPADLVTPGPSISQIETVDIRNQHWSIPFNPTPGTPATSHEQETPGPSPWPAYNPAFATPQIQPRSVGGGSAQQPSPPAVTEPSGSGETLSFTQSIDPNQIAPPPVEAPKTAPASVLQRGALVYHVNPIYPELAKEQEVQGTVKLDVTIGTDGVVRSVIAESGPGLLVEAARSAVRRWRYTPTLLNGKPVESETTVSVVFRLPQSSP